MKRPTALLLAAIMLIAAGVYRTPTPVPVDISTAYACWTEATAYGPEQICGDPGLAQNRIEEDSPAWECETMGNHICGANPSRET